MTPMVNFLQGRQMEKYYGVDIFHLYDLARMRGFEPASVQIKIPPSTPVSHSNWFLLRILCG